MVVQSPYRGAALYLQDGCEKLSLQLVFWANVIIEVYCITGRFPQREQRQFNLGCGQHHGSTRIMIHVLPFLILRAERSPAVRICNDRSFLRRSMLCQWILHFVITTQPLQCSLSMLRPPLR